MPHACPFCGETRPDWLPGEALEGEHQWSLYGLVNGIRWNFIKCCRQRMGDQWATGAVNETGELREADWRALKEGTARILTRGPADELAWAAA